MNLRFNILFLVVIGLVQGKSKYQIRVNETIISCSNFIHIGIENELKIKEANRV